MKNRVYSLKKFLLIFFFLNMAICIFGQSDKKQSNNTYLIIASDDYINSPSLNSFIAFREQDFTVELVSGTSIGSTKDDYRNYIRNFMPEYILLVGKYGDFPVHTVPYPKEVETYNYYVASSTTGHPNQDIPLGLFLAENETELSNIINKTISFENNYNDYPKIYYGHAGSNDTLPPWPIQFNEEILTEMYTHYFAPESYTFTLATANDSTPNDAWTDINMINSGIRYMIYHGHGNIMKWSFGLGTGGLQNLNNTIYPIIFSFACLTGTFSGSVDGNTYDCFAQKITTLEHGAVAFLGAYNTAGKGMNQILEGAINGLFNDTITPRLGNVLLHAYANTNNTNTVNLYYPTVQAVERERAAWQFHLFGDPALKIRSDVSSTHEISQDNPKIIAYPNPTNGIVSINSNTEILEFVIFSVNGVKLYDSNSISIIDLSNYPKGIYIISIKTKNGIVYRKIIRI
jgi:hypothetical protein